MFPFIKETEISEKKHQFTLFRTKLNVKTAKFQLPHSQSQYQQIF